MPAMLPDGFQWVPRYQYAEHELALKLDHRTVAQLMQRMGGSWYAQLDCQRPIGAPMRMRDCQSRETGIAGIEAWACRHEARLRAEVDAMPKPRHLGVG